MTSMVDQLLQMCEQRAPEGEEISDQQYAAQARPLPGEGPWPPEALSRVAKQQSVIEQLQAELASTKNELDFVSLEREEQLKKRDETAHFITAMSDQVKGLEGKLRNV